MLQRLLQAAGLLSKHHTQPLSPPGWCPEQASTAHVDLDRAPYVLYGLNILT